jgi:hypothetical protein
MADAAFLTEVTVAILHGIATASQGKLEKVSRDNDSDFPNRRVVSRLLQSALGKLGQWRELHNGPLMKPSQMYCLILAVAHVTSPIGPLQQLFKAQQAGIPDRASVLASLSTLADAIENQAAQGSLKEFVNASLAGTNTEKNRATRFKFFCNALKLRRA